MAMKRFSVCAVALAFLAFLAFPLAGIAAERGPGAMPGPGPGTMGPVGTPGMTPGVAGPRPMPGMKMEEHGRMGDRIFGGKIGPWQCEARLMDMKSHMEQAKASGMKMGGMANRTHHMAIHLTDAGTKKPVVVTSGKGTVTVTGPDRKEEKYNCMVMEGHFGADVDLPKPGKYAFKTEIESGGKKGSTSFSYTVK